VDPLERLVAYLDGELDPDARRAVEEELAVDAALRADLAAVRRADTVLDGLRSPTPADGFDARLLAALEPTIAEVLRRDPEAAADPTDATDRAGEERDTARATEAGAARPWTATAATHGPEIDTTLEDELAARRANRPTSATPRWATVAAGVAAAVLLLAGGGLVLTNLLGSGDDADDGAAFDTMAESDDAGDDAVESGPAAGLPGPEIVRSERDLDAGAVDALLSSGALATFVDAALDPVAGGDVARDYRFQLGAGEPEASVESEPGASEESEQDRSTDDADVADDTDPIGRCVAEVTRDAPAAIPVYVELASFEGTPVVVVGLVTVDPATGAYTRPEAWVLDRASCQPLRFSQG
jgi:anti-sigma factor RsiW